MLHKQAPQTPSKTRGRKLQHKSLAQLPIINKPIPLSRSIELRPSVNEDAKLPLWKFYKLLLFGKTVIYYSKEQLYLARALRGCYGFFLK